MNANNIKLLDDMATAGYLIERPQDAHITDIAKVTNGRNQELVMYIRGERDPKSENYNDVKVIMYSNGGKDKDIVKYGDIQMKEYVNQENGRRGVQFMDRSTSKDYTFENIKRGDFCPNCQSINVYHDYTDGKNMLICEDCGYRT